MHDDDHGPTRPRSPWRRALQLVAGLVAYGVSIGMMVRADLGLSPWDVFHQGLARRTGIAVGTAVILVGAAVLLLWIPLRERPGIGTVSNVVLVGAAANVTLDLLDTPSHPWLRWGLLVGGILLCGVATGAYLGAHLGPGPRDGLMTGLARRGQSLRVVRTVLELTVLAVGFLLGGTVGPGTVLFALLIGPVVHVTIPLFSASPPRRATGASRGPRG